MDGVNSGIQCLYQPAEICPLEQKTNHILHAYVALLYGREIWSVKEDVIKIGCECDQTRKE